MGVLNIQPIRKVGPVQVVAVNAVGDTAGSQRYPSDSFDDLSDERLYRLILSFQLTFHFVDLLDDFNARLSLTGAELNGNFNSRRIWEHYLPSATQTNDPNNLQGAQTMATVNRFQVNDLGDVMTGMLIPPGFALTITGSGGAADNCQIQMMVAVSADPNELKPFVGWRTGGIAGPQ